MNAIIVVSRAFEWGQTRLLSWAPSLRWRRRSETPRRADHCRCRRTNARRRNKLIVFTSKHVQSRPTIYLLVCFIHSFIRSFIHPSIHPFIRYLFYSIIYLLTLLNYQRYLFIDSLIDWLIDWLVDWLIGWLICILDNWPVVSINVASLYEA